MIDEEMRKKWKGGYQIIEKGTGPIKKVRRTYSGAVAGEGAMMLKIINRRIEI